MARNTPTASSTEKGPRSTVRMVNGTYTVLPMSDEWYAVTATMAAITT